MTSVSPTCLPYRGYAGVCVATVRVAEILPPRLVRFVHPGTLKL